MGGHRRSAIKKTLLTDDAGGERVRYAQLRYAMSEAAKVGWDPEEISRAALKGAAERFRPK